MAQDKKHLYIISRESVVEARRLTDIDNDGEVLLVGRGLFLPIKLFGNKQIYAIAEEVQEQGLQDKLTEGISCLAAKDVLNLILERQVFNFS